MYTYIDWKEQMNVCQSKFYIAIIASFPKEVKYNKIGPREQNFLQ